MPLYGLSGVFTVVAPPPTEVPSTWSLIPSGLGEGDEFRLLFVSSTTRNAASASISTYNTWIQNQAAAGHTDIQDYSDTFRVVGSTAAVDARDNTYSTYTSSDKGVPIYWLNGNKVVDQYEDFYDGGWDDEANMKTEDGDSTSPSHVYTGSDGRRNGGVWNHRRCQSCLGCYIRSAWKAEPGRCPRWSPLWRWHRPQ